MTVGGQTDVSLPSVGSTYCDRRWADVSLPSVGSTYCDRRWADVSLPSVGSTYCDRRWADVFLPPVAVLYLAHCLCRDPRELGIQRWATTLPSFCLLFLLISQPLQDKLQWLKSQTPPKIQLNSVATTSSQQSGHSFY